MPSSREIARVVAPAPKRNVISRCIRRIVSLLVGIPHSIDCDGAVDASSMLTRETPPLPGRPLHTSGRLRQNAGRHQIGMLDGIRSEHWTPSAQNAWTASVRNLQGRGVGQSWPALSRPKFDSIASHNGEEYENLTGDDHTLLLVDGSSRAAEVARLRQLCQAGPRAGLRIGSFDREKEPQLLVARAE